MSAQTGTIQRDLASGFEGELVEPDGALYDEARAVYNGMIDRRPAVIARCATGEGVARTIRFARAQQMPLAVRGGGHSGGGFGVVDDGIVIDLSPMKAIEVDPGARTVRVGGGCRWGEVDRATGEHGLALPSGFVANTGVGGLTLGGGHGYLTRKYGLTIDNLLEAEVVLADGSTVRASGDENNELFWAIRGGGGNFGVVTSFTFRLHPVGTVTAGPTMWPIEMTADVLRFFSELIADAPRDFNGWFGVASVPPAPAFPEELHLRKVAMVMWCHSGSPEEAEEALRPVREFGPPLLDGIGEAPYAAVQSAFDELFPPGLQWYWKHDFVRELPPEAMAVHEEMGKRLPTPYSTMHLYPVDGAVHDVGASDTAFAFRDCRFSQVIVGIDPDPAKADELKAYATEYWEALRPYSAGGGYVNMNMGESNERVRASYGDNYDRLARIKAVYDPGNLFRANQNIPPQG
jgi:FAD/FMN-containing dehydrogenase